jgi:haloacetate dehalogenase
VGGRRVLPLRGGGPIDSGHHVAEEAPDELVAALVPFLRV